MVRNKTQLSRQDERRKEMRSLEWERNNLDKQIRLLVMKNIEIEHEESQKNPSQEIVLIEKQINELSAKRNNLIRQWNIHEKEEEKEKKRMPLRERVVRVVAGICLILLGILLLTLAKSASTERPTGVASGWFLLFGFIPVPMFFVADTVLGSILFGIFGVGCIGLAFEVIFGRKKWY